MWCTLASNAAHVLIADNVHNRMRNENIEDIQPFDSFINASFKFRTKNCRPQCSTSTRHTPTQFIEISCANTTRAIQRKNVPLSLCCVHVSTATSRFAWVLDLDAYCGAIPVNVVEWICICLLPFLASLFASHNTVDWNWMNWNEITRGEREAKWSFQDEFSVSCAVFVCWAAPNLIFTYNFLKALNARKG